MIGFLVATLLAISTTPVTGQIGGDLNCTTYNGTEFVYTPSAVACSNAVSDASCQALYPAADETVGYPAAGNNAGRPLACFTTAAETPAPVDADMKKAAMTNCAKTCGFCCQTDDYNCANVQFPRLNCATITTAQCFSAQWRTIIATDCPSACGFCNSGGCVDAVVECANDLSICQTVGMQDFVNQNCQRTCGRCASTTGLGGITSGTGTCNGNYIADSSSACSSWADNGFCTNSFYTEAQRRSYCGTTCRIC